MDQHYARASEKWFCFHRWSIEIVEQDTITFFRLWNSQDLFSPSAAHSIDMQAIAVNAVLFSNAFLTAWVDKGVFLPFFFVLFFLRTPRLNFSLIKLCHTVASHFSMRTRAGRLGKTIWHSRVVLSLAAVSFFLKQKTYLNNNLNWKHNFLKHQMILLFSDFTT